MKSNIRNEEKQMPVNSFDDYPMSWKPILKNEKNPIYIELANNLEEDIRKGILTPGTKLPPQRELADYLDINLSTVTRAFKICEQRGLLCSAVGKGTFVSSDAASNSVIMLNRKDKNVIEMGAILPNSEINKLSAQCLMDMTTEPDFYKLLQYGVIEYDDLQIKAAKMWLQYSHLSTTKENILFSTGSQNGIFATLCALFKHGDRIGTMPTTYPGLKIAAKILGIQLIPLSMKDGKITKEVLRYAYKNHNIKVLYFIPDFNNPTSEILDIKTRKMIADFCEENALPIIEDGIYTLYMKDPLPSIASFTKHQGIFISSVSKALTPGLRLAVLHTPVSYYQAIKESLYAMQITPPALLLQLFTRLVISKRFEEIRRLRMEDVLVRNQIFDEIMVDQITCGNQYSPIRWLTLPDHYTSDEFEKIALSENIQIYGAGRFTVGTSVIPNAIRISLLSAQPIELYRAGLKKLHTLITK